MFLMMQRFTQNTFPNIESGSMQCYSTRPTVKHEVGSALQTAQSLVTMTMEIFRYQSIRINSIKQNKAKQVYTKGEISQFS